MTPPAADLLVMPAEFAPPRISLADVHRSIPVPAPTAKFWRKLGAFAGPGYLVAVGYMDPGNWATDLAGGSSFGYTLLWESWGRSRASIRAAWICPPASRTGDQSDS